MGDALRFVSQKGSAGRARDAAALAGMLALAIPSSARADDPTTPPKAADAKSDAPRSDAAPPPHPETLPPRTDAGNGATPALQDYEGRPHRTTVGEDLLWIPRVVFFPLYAVTEFGIRRPAYALAKLVEKNQVIPRIADIFTFGPHDNAGLIPTAFYELGFRPSIGLYFFYDDFLAPYNALRVHFSTGGEKWFLTTITDRIPLALWKDETGATAVRSYLKLRADGLNRADLKFFGMGYNSRDDAEGNFEERTSGLTAQFHLGIHDQSFFESWLLLRRQSFADADCAPELVATGGAAQNFVPVCTTQTLKSMASSGAYSIPPGFERGYSHTKVGGRLVLDSRPARPEPGSGAALDIRGELATAFDGEVGSWAAYGGTVAGFVDITGTRRVLSLALSARFADPFQENFAVPFTELAGAPRFDGIREEDILLGFRPGQLLGNSEVAATLRYDWPVWALTDGTIQLATGNAFGPHFEDFEFDRLRLSFVAGLTSTSRRDHAFNMLIGFGTRPFESGAAPENVRFYVGGTTGF